MSRHSVERLNQLIAAFGFRRYLEVGVQRGLTFTEVQAETKVAVDPRFLFDHGERAALHPNEAFHQVTSDDYFRVVRPAPFDLIFLDGLHTFEQTFRDFCNAVTRCLPHSVIVIDDTVPSDVYSAHPAQAVAVAMRRKEMPASPSRAWHGDVYKTVFAIAEYFPQFSYRTITAGGNPQTVLWHQPRPVVGRLPSLEAISRLSYFDLQKHLDVMNPVDDFGVIVAAIAASQGRPLAAPGAVAEPVESPTPV